MRKLVFLSLIVVFYHSTAFAQDNTIRVLGYCAYAVGAKAQGVLITIPDLDSLKKRSFLDTLKKLNLNYNLFPQQDYTFMGGTINKYKLESSSSEDFEMIVKICNQFQIPMENHYYKMPVQKYEEEDKWAIQAVRNAEIQAKILSGHINKKVKGIISIDDDTTMADPTYMTDDVDPEIIEKINSFLMEIGYGGDPTATEINQPKRLSAYGIWVTFEVGE